MYSASEAATFVRKLLERVPRVNIWAYSGFLYEEIAGNEAMADLL